MYGDRQFIIDTKAHQIKREKRVNNGVFNTVIKSNVLNRQVSAVALYRERFLRASYERQLCVYHNPYALNPLPEEIFSDVPQFVFRKDENGSGHMQYLNETRLWHE